MDQIVRGWSMGGYGALLAAEIAHDVFGSVCAVSPALWTNAADQERAVPDAFDGEADFDANNVFRGANTLRRVRIACGTKDPFYRASTEFVATLREHGNPPETEFAVGFHDDAFWRLTATDNFSFFF